MTPANVDQSSNARCQEDYSDPPKSENTPSTSTLTCIVSHYHADVAGSVIGFLYLLLEVLGYGDTDMARSNLGDGEGVDYFKWSELTCEVLVRDILPDIRQEVESTCEADGLSLNACSFSYLHLSATSRNLRPPIVFGRCKIADIPGPKISNKAFVAGCWASILAN
jgi:hypothetical protein